MNRKKYLLSCLLAAGFVFAAVTSGFCTPVLGVATDSGYYVHPQGETPETGGYIDYFVDHWIESTNGDHHGFYIGPSGSKLTVFAEQQFLTDYDLYLVASTHLDPSTIGVNGSGYDSGVSFSGTAPGYAINPYYGFTLPSINSGGWTNMGNVFEQSKNYWFYEATLTYGGDLALGDYFFAAAAGRNNDGLLKFPSSPDVYSSPRTSSAYGGPIPEPASILLLGIGVLLGGFAGLKKKKLFKRF